MEKIVATQQTATEPEYEYMWVPDHEYVSLTISSTVTFISQISSAALSVILYNMKILL